MNFYALILVLLSVTALAFLLPSAAQTGEPEPPAVTHDLLPEGNVTGPVGNTGAVTEKFDDGFYDDVLALLQEEPLEGNTNVYDGRLHHNVIIVVSRDDGDGRDADLVSSENKADVVEKLNLLGARDVLAAESLSFVTATVPVVAIPGLSLHDEIYRMGDGELPVTLEVDMARVTIHATADEMRESDGTVLNGSGVVVGVIDTGIHHPVSLNGKVMGRVLCSDTGCEPSTTANITGMDGLTNSATSHGTRVAQVLAASGFPAHNGIAPGVELYDAGIGRHITSGPTPSILAHALDSSLRNGADVVNMSVGGGLCSTVDETAYTLVVNEAVDKGMVVVKSAGNSGYDFNTNPHQANYQSITNPGCGHNIITVGGINDRDPVITMAINSSRGPTSNDEPLLRPEVVAPAVDIQVLSHVANSDTIPNNGTSLAAPQVSATAALLLQANPELTPVETKATILLGANWTGPVPCTSVQYERNDTGDGCSNARQPGNLTEANGAASLEILNNVGFGILDVNQTLEYASEGGGSHVIGGHLDSDSDVRWYNFTVTDTTEPVKVILSWMVHPHGGIVDQPGRSIPRVSHSNLGFTLQCPGMTNAENIDSVHQQNEFTVFVPNQTGVCAVKVTGSNVDNINKPVQNYAIASTLPLVPLSTDHTPVNSVPPNSTSANSTPTAHNRTVFFDPDRTAVVDSNRNDPVIVRLFGDDGDGDSVSFSILSDPEHGIASVDEFITKNASRMLYTPDTSFNATDSFTVVPHDGTAAGAPATVTIRAESLPANSTMVGLVSAIPDWTTLNVSSSFFGTDYTKEFDYRGYMISSMQVGSENMEGIDFRFETDGGGSYVVAIPPSGDRRIEFSPPINITSGTITAAGADEETAYERNRANQTGPYVNQTYRGIKAYVGTIPYAGTCSVPPGESGAAARICVPAPTRIFSSMPDLAIPDRSNRQSTPDIITVPANGTISTLSVSVNVTHSWPAQLRVVLTSPDGTEAVLHDRTAGGRNIVATYDQLSSAALLSLVGSAAAGHWTLSVGDYGGNVVGMFNSWDLEIGYTQEPVTVQVPPTTPPTVTLFAEDFEEHHFISWAWNGTGEGAGHWEDDRSSSVPGHPSGNRVLHADDCDDPCSAILKTPLNLTAGYGSASLSFWRFVDSDLDDDDYLRVDAYDGSVWRTVSLWSEDRGADGTWRFETHDLTPYLGATDFGVRFVTQMSSSSEDVYLDDVAITVLPGTPPAPSRLVTAFVDDFESGSLDSWFEAGNGDWEPDKRSVPEAGIGPDSSFTNGVMHARDCDTDCFITLREPLDLSGYSSANLTFWRSVDSNLEAGEYLKVEAYDGSSWNTIYNWSPSLGGDDNTWHYESYNLSPYLGTTDFNVRFVAKANFYSEDIYLDEVTVSAIWETSPPQPPGQPTEIFSDDFQSAALGSWDRTGTDRWSVIEPQNGGHSRVLNQPASNTVLHVDGCSSDCVITLRNPLDLSYYASASLTFMRVIDSSLSSNEHFKVEAYDGSGWNTLYDWSGGDNIWYLETHDLEPYLDVTDFKIKLTSSAGSSRDDIQVDNVVVSGVPKAGTLPPRHTLFSDDFGATTFDARWAQTGDGDWSLTASGGVPDAPGHAPTDRALHADDCTTPCILTMRNPVNLAAGYDTASLSFWRFVDSSISYDEHLKVEAYDGSAWNTLYHWSGRLGGDDNAWHMESYNLTSYLNVDDFRIRLVTQQDDHREDIEIDDIIISANTTGGTVTQPPVQPPVVPSTNSTIFSDSFEAPNFDPNWQESGDLNWRLSTSTLYSVPVTPGHSSSNQVLLANDCDDPCMLTMRYPIDLSGGYPSASLSLWRYVDSKLDQGEYLKVEAYGGTSWTALSTWTHGSGDDSLWHLESLDLADHLGVSDFMVRFVTEASSTTEHVQVDDASITVGLVTGQSPPQVTTGLLYDEFSDVTPYENWEETGDMRWWVTQPSSQYAPAVPNHPSGNTAVHADNCDNSCTLTLRSPIDMTAYGSASLTFWRFVDSGLDGSEYLKVEAYDGSSWNTLYHWSGNNGGDDNTWHMETFNLSSYLSASNFKLRIITQQSSSSEDVMLDDIEITAIRR